MVERIPVDVTMHKRLLVAARDYRKAPTPSERRLWKALQGRQIEGAKFRRQQPVGPFIADFLCFHYRLIVEVDGPIHTSQVIRDRERQALLEASGYRVIRVTAVDVEQDIDAVLARIREALVSQRGMEEE